MEKLDLAASFARLTDQYNPPIVGESNGHRVKLVKVQGARCR